MVKDVETFRLPDAIGKVGRRGRHRRNDGNWCIWEKGGERNAGQRWNK